MSGFSDGGNRHVLETIDGYVKILHDEFIEVCIYDHGDSVSFDLDSDQAEDLSAALRLAVFHTAKRRSGKERRMISRETCSEDCTLAPNHPGPHRGACGCINGCKAWKCPNG